MEDFLSPMVDSIHHYRCQCATSLMLCWVKASPLSCPDLFQSHFGYQGHPPLQHLQHYYCSYHLLLILLILHYLLFHPHTQLSLKIQLWASWTPLIVMTPFSNLFCHLYTRRFIIFNYDHVLRTFRLVVVSQGRCLVLLCPSRPPRLFKLQASNHELELVGVFLFGRGFAANCYHDQSSLLPGNAVRGLFEGGNLEDTPAPRVLL